MKQILSVMILGASIGILLSCAQKEFTDSNLEHVFGDTFTQRTKALSHCHEEAKKNENPASQTTKAYLEKLIDFVIDRNNQSSNVFTGYLSRNNFCVTILNSKEDNAWASVDSGLISVNAGIFATVESDAMLAGVLAHELAHITLNHTGTAPEATFSGRLSTTEQAVFKNANAQMTSAHEIIFKIDGEMKKIFEIDDSDYSGEITKGTSIRIQQEIDEAILQAKCEERCAEFSQLGFALTQQLKSFEDFQQIRRNLIKKHYNAEEIANKIESDADEVGLEFIARADINPNAYYRFDLLLAREYDKLSSCSGLFKRGRMSHPANCWRFQNDISELKKHRKNYSRFFKHRQVSFISNPSLEDAKREIAAVVDSICDNESFTKCIENGGDYTCYTKYSACKISDIICNEDALENCLNGKGGNACYAKLNCSRENRISSGYE